jgi:hypothetical protein
MRNDKRGRERKEEDGRRAKVNLDSGVLKIKKTKNDSPCANFNRIL